jgi:predicted Rossmann fold flavoprotein
MKHSENKNESYDYVIVGGGASGIFSAVQSCIYAEEKLFAKPLRVLVLEGSRRLLTKVKISGGGRCNVTHHQFDPKKLIENYPRGSKELRGPFSRFQPKDTVDFFESRGVNLKTEKDGRMFPVTDNSQSIIDCLLGEVEKYGVTIQKGFMLNSISKVEGGYNLEDIKGNLVSAQKVMIATGSNPKVWSLIENLGIEIISPVPSLFTFKIKDRLLDELYGTSFESAHLKLSIEGVKTKKKPGFDFRGPLLITHWGLSGPAVLKLSAFAARELFASNYKATLTCNFMDNLNSQQVVEILKVEASKNRKQKPTKFSPFKEITKRFWHRLLEVSEWDDYNNWSEVPGKKITKLAENICSYSFEVDGKGEFKDEFVTAGGVNLKEIDLRTMESKKFSGLYFGGEVTNVDGITGGFNFQNAWTSGYLAAQSVVDSLSNVE